MCQARQSSGEDSAATPHLSLDWNDELALRSPMLVGGGGGAAPSPPGLGCVNVGIIFPLR